MQPAGLEQRRHRRDRIEFGRGRKIQARRIAPGPAHQIVHAEIGDIDQHQAGEDFAGAETAPCRSRGSARRARRRARRESASPAAPKCPTSVPLVSHREPAAAHRADDELALGADVPDIGDVAERQDRPRSSPAASP